MAKVKVSSLVKQLYSHEQGWCCHHCQGQSLMSCQTIIQPYTRMITLVNVYSLKAKVKVSSLVKQLYSHEQGWCCHHCQGQSLMSCQTIIQPYTRMITLVNVYSLKSCQTNTAMHKDDAVTIIKVYSLKVLSNQYSHAQGWCYHHGQG